MGHLGQRRVGGREARVVQDVKSVRCPRGQQATPRSLAFCQGMCLGGAYCTGVCNAKTTLAGPPRIQAIYTRPCSARAPAAKDTEGSVWAKPVGRGTPGRGEGWDPST